MPLRVEVDVTCLRMCIGISMIAEVVCRGYIRPGEILVEATAGMSRIGSALAVVRCSQFRCLFLLSVHCRIVSCSFSGSMGFSLPLVVAAPGTTTIPGACRRALPKMADDGFYRRSVI